MIPIVDVHCHYLSGDKEALANFKRLVASPEVCRIVVVALDLKLTYDPRLPFMSIFATTNEQLAEFIRKVDSPKLVPFCFADPREPDAPKKTEYWLKQGGMRGVKLYPPSGWYPDDPRAVEICKVAEACNVPVLMHMGRVAVHPQLRSKFARPLYLEDIGLACPNLKLIIGHFAAPWYREAAHIAMGFPNFYFDLTTSGSWDIEALRFVADGEYLGLYRIVLGTDGDGNTNLRRAAETLQRLSDGGFTPAEVETIAQKNGLAVLGES